MVDARGATMTQPAATPTAAARDPRRALAWVTLTSGALVSLLIAGWHAAAWSKIDNRERLLGFLALLICVLALDSLAKARVGLPVAAPGPYKLRLAGMTLLTLLASALLIWQITLTGLEFNMRFMFDALFIAVGLVGFGQTLFSAAPA
jgi:hypothetical protein